MQCFLNQISRSLGHCVRFHITEPFPCGSLVTPLVTPWETCTSRFARIRLSKVLWHAKFTQGRHTTWCQRRLWRDKNKTAPRLQSRDGLFRISNSEGYESQTIRNINWNIDQVSETGFISTQLRWSNLFAVISHIKEQWAICSAIRTLRERVVPSVFVREFRLMRIDLVIPSKWLNLESWNLDST